MRYSRRKGSGKEGYTIITVMIVCALLTGILVTETLRIMAYHQTATAWDRMMQMRVEQEMSRAIMREIIYDQFEARGTPNLAPGLGTLQAHYTVAWQTFFDLPDAELYWVDVSQTLPLVLGDGGFEQVGDPSAGFPAAIWDPSEPSLIGLYEGGDPDRVLLNTAYNTWRGGLNVRTDRLLHAGGMRPTAIAIGTLDFQRHGDMMGVAFAGDVHGLQNFNFNPRWTVHYRVGMKPITDFSIVAFGSLLGNDPSLVGRPQRLAETAGNFIQEARAVDGVGVNEILVATGFADDPTENGSLPDLADGGLPYSQRERVALGWTLYDRIWLSHVPALRDAARANGTVLNLADMIAFTQLDPDDENYLDDLAELELPRHLGVGWEWFPDSSAIEFFAGTWAQDDDVVWLVTGGTTWNGSPVMLRWMHPGYNLGLASVGPYNVPALPHIVVDEGAYLRIHGLGGGTLEAFIYVPDGAVRWDMFGAPEFEGALFLGRDGHAFGRPRFRGHFSFPANWDGFDDANGFWPTMVPTVGDSAFLRRLMPFSPQQILVSTSITQ